MTATAVVSPTVMDHTPLERNPFGKVLLDIPEESSKTAADFMQAAHLDWIVEKRTPVTVGSVEFRKRAGIVAVDEGREYDVDVVSTKYEVIQNVDAYRPFDYLIAEGLFTGWEQGGRWDYDRTFGLIGLASECSWEHDPRRRKAIVSTSHDATGAYLVKPWAERIRCTNQEGMIFSRGGGVIRVKHTRSSRELMRRMTDAVAHMVAVQDEHENLMLALAQTSIRPKDVGRFVERLFPDRRGVMDAPNPDRGTLRAATMLRVRRDEVRALAEHGPTLEGLRERYGMSKGVLLNAAIEWSDYFARTRGVDPQDRRALKMLMGADMTFKRRAARIIDSL